MEKAHSDFLFVYSSLRMGFQNEKYEYIRRYFSFEGNVKAKGLLSDLGNYPVATPTDENYFIKGELYKINDPNEFSFAIGQLDDYEGVSPETDETALYRRDLTTIFRNDGSTVDAWIYWYNGDVAGKPVIASGDVIDYVLSKPGE